MEAGGADGVAGAGEFPEAIGVVDVDVGDGAVVLAGVDEAEVVGARRALLEVGGEDVGGEDALVDGGVEEGRLWVGGDWAVLAFG